MAVNIRQAFLQHAEQRQFHVTRQARKILRYFTVHLNPAALRKSLHVPSRRHSQSRLVQQRRMQQIRNSARLRHRLLQVRPRAVQQLVRAIRAAAACHGIQAHLRRRQILPQAVVQFSRKLSPLLVLQVQQPRAQLPRRLLALARKFFRLLSLHQFRREHPVVQIEERQRYRERGDQNPQRRREPCA